MKRRNFDGMDYVEDFTGGKPEYTDAEGRAWITPDTLAQRFRDLCAATGMTGKALAEYTGVTAVTLSGYRTGKSPVPRSVWRLVETRKL
ncbi:MAG: helix-turn-helix domain-containing protein [Clostridia bacterium]|nr:helix-turn-helix domain-containing protein [Clostridia bacterium]